MNTDPQLGSENLIPLLARFKFHTHKFPPNPSSAPFLVLTDGNGELSANPRPAFNLGWEDQAFGVSVVMHEQQDGRLLAEVSCTRTDLLDTSAVSVALMGMQEGQLLRKTVFLTVSENKGRSGSKDFGTLAAAVKEVGPQISLLVFLMI